MIATVLAWLTDPLNWSGSGGIAARLGEHLLYSVVTLALAAVVAVPAGLYIGHSGRARWVVSAANAARAVPSLGLLFAVAMLLGPHVRGDLAFVVPSIVTLVVLALPPLLSGAYAGVGSVDPAARDAARGMGMTGWQVLRDVEVPCALPLVLSGVRSATLQVVATATIASFISLGGLGVFLVDGLASGDYPQMAGGAILVALLALGLDLAVALLTRVVVSPGLGAVRGPRRPRRAASSPASASSPVATDRARATGAAGVQAGPTGTAAPGGTPSGSTPSTHHQSGRPSHDA